MQSIVSRLKSMNRWVVGGVLVVVVGIGALAFSKSAQPVQRAQARPQTVTVTSGDLEGTVTTSGQLTPKRDASLAFNTPGIVKEVHVAQGDVVKQGDVLVKLDDAIASNNLEKAKVGLQTAQVKLDSAQHDYDNKVGWTPDGNQVNAAVAGVANAEAAVKAAQSNYDKVAWVPWVSSTQQSMALEQATNTYNQARANLDYLYSNSPDIVFAKDNLQTAQLAENSAEVDLKTAQDTLDRMTLSAPFDGTITSVNTEVGEMAAGAVVEMATMDHLEVILDVDEVDVGALKVGQPAKVTFSAWPGSTVTGKIITIAPKANATANVVNFEVHIALDKTDLDLRAGMTADASIQTFLLKNVMILPRDAVMTDAQTNKAYVSVVGPTGDITQTEVKLGQRNDDSVQIVSGLKAGDVVLANPSQPVAAQ
jgi:HlyD family secretion protein